MNPNGDDVMEHLGKIINEKTPGNLEEVVQIEMIKVLSDVSHCIRTGQQIHSEALPELDLAASANYYFNRESTAATTARLFALVMRAISGSRTVREGALGGPPPHMGMFPPMPMMGALPNLGPMVPPGLAPLGSPGLAPLVPPSLAPLAQSELVVPLPPVYPPLLMAPPELVVSSAPMPQTNARPAESTPIVAQLNIDNNRDVGREVVESPRVMGSRVERTPEQKAARAVQIAKTLAEYFHLIPPEFAGVAAAAVAAATPNLQPVQQQQRDDDGVGLANYGAETGMVVVKREPVDEQETLEEMQKTLEVVQKTPKMSTEEMEKFIFRKLEKNANNITAKLQLQMKQEEPEEEEEGYGDEVGEAECLQCEMCDESYVIGHLSAHYDVCRWREKMDTS